MKDLVIIGAGGCGQEVAMLVEEINAANPEWNLIGFADDNQQIQGIDINEIPVAGTIDELIQYASDDLYVVCAIASYDVKYNIIKRLSLNKHLKFATIIHPSVRINRTLEIGEGSILYHDVLMTVNVKVGNHVIISPRTNIGHGSHIGDFSNLMWNVNIAGDVIVENGVYCGTGSTVIQKKTIKEGSIIGAGAVVINDVPEWVTCVGVPAEII